MHSIDNNCIEELPGGRYTTYDAAVPPTMCSTAPKTVTCTTGNTFEHVVKRSRGVNIVMQLCRVSCSAQPKSDTCKVEIVSEQQQHRTCT